MKQCPRCTTQSPQASIQCTGCSWYYGVDMGNNFPQVTLDQTIPYIMLDENTMVRSDDVVYTMLLSEDDTNDTADDAGAARQD